MRRHAGTFAVGFDHRHRPDLTAGIAAGPLIAGFLASFITGCLACKFMIEVVKRGKLIWFAVYCTVAGLVSITSYFC